jgi:uncharacterized protein YkwD
MDRGEILLTAMKAIWLALALATASPSARAEDVASMISQYRHAHGLSVVKTDPQLTAFAERQAQAMAKRGVLDHSVAGPFAARIAGMPFAGAGENIAEGTRSWAETLERWKASAGHNENLLAEGSTHVGVAVAYGKDNDPFRAMVIGRKLTPQTVRTPIELPVLDGFPH